MNAPTRTRSSAAGTILALTLGQYKGVALDKVTEAGGAWIEAKHQAFPYVAGGARNQPTEPKAGVKCHSKGTAFLDEVGMHNAGRT
jgi:hypothetical protein